MRVEQLTIPHPDTPRAKALYERAFPANERRRFEELLDERNIFSQALGFYAEGDFCGFAILLHSCGIWHIIYFAIEEALRGRGHGTLALRAMHQAKVGSRMIVDIERDNVPCKTPAQRTRRKQFYLRNGYRETEVKYRWQGEDYEILAYGGSLTWQEFEDFWDNIRFAENP